MTDRVGRHAAARDAAETLIIPAQALPYEAGDRESTADPAHPADRSAEPAERSAQPADRAAEPVLRATGKHASARPADDGGPGAGHRGNGSPVSPRAGRSGAGSARSAAGSVRPDEITAIVESPVPADNEPAGQRQRSAAGSNRKLRIVWVYPDLLSTYGDRGNLLVLSRRARLRDIEVEAIEVKSDESVPTQGDIYLLGGGEDLPQILAASRLRTDGGLAAAASRGAVVFAVCAGYQLLGSQFGGVDGEPVPGLSILDMSSGRGDRRGVGELVADVDPALSVPRLTGFENHQGVTRRGPGAQPLATVSQGVGNGDGTEGAYAGKVLGTYMHGPALARNPGLADLLLSWAVGRLRPLDPASEEWAAQLRSERLAAVAR